MTNGAPGGHEHRNPSGHEKRYPEPFRKTKCGHENRDSEGHEFWHLVLNKNSNINLIKICKMHFNL